MSEVHQTFVLSNLVDILNDIIIFFRWDVALELAEKYDFPQVEGLLARYASQLTSENRRLEAVELYRSANRPTEAALLIGDLAEQAARRDVKPSLAKKLHVLAALEVERHRKRTMDLATQATMGGTAAGGTIAQATAATLETLMMTSLDTQLGTGHYIYVYIYIYIYINIYI
jgi:WD repeat-containing protein 35